MRIIIDTRAYTGASPEFDLLSVRFHICETTSIIMVYFFGLGIALVLSEKHDHE